MLGSVSFNTFDYVCISRNSHLFVNQGGFCGFFYVASNILAVPRLGVGTSLALFVCAQVLQHLAFCLDLQKNGFLTRLI